MDASRRDFLKKGAVTGALVWAAPAITTLSGGTARAQGSPPVGACCSAEAYGLSVVVPALTIDQIFGSAPGCNQENPGDPVNLATAGVVAQSVGALTACDEDGCTARSFVTALSVTRNDVTASAVALNSDVTGDCDTCGVTRGGGIASVIVNGTPVDASAPPNTLVVNAGGVLVVVNEQGCTGGTRFTNALHITITVAGDVVFELIAGHSEVTMPNCPC